MFYSLTLKQESFIYLKAKKISLFFRKHYNIRKINLSLKKISKTRSK